MDEHWHHHHPQLDHQQIMFCFGGEDGEFPCEQADEGLPCGGVYWSDSSSDPDQRGSWLPCRWVVVWNDGDLTAAEEPPLFVRLEAAT